MKVYIKGSKYYPLPQNVLIITFWIIVNRSQMIASKLFKIFQKMRYWNSRWILCWEIPWVVISTIRSVSCPSHTRCLCHTKCFRYNRSKRRQYRSCDWDATLFSSIWYMESKIHGVPNKDKMQPTHTYFVLYPARNGWLTERTDCDHFVGYLLIWWNEFWFAFTLYRYYVSMDITSCTYGKKGQILYTVRSKLNTTKYERDFHFRRGFFLALSKVKLHYIVNGRRMKSNLFQKLFNQFLFLFHF